MKIWIRNLQKRFPFDSKKLRKAAEAVLEELGSPESELGVSLVDDKRIQELNRRYLGRDRPTNVLAFSMREGDFPSLHPHLLGDVVVSVDTAKRQSNRFGLMEHEMVLLLIIHGVLHLFGYEHEKTAKGASEMARKQKALFKKIVPLLSSLPVGRGCVHDADLTVGKKHDVIPADRAAG